jgi:hypothetical protein
LDATKIPEKEMQFFIAMGKFDVLCAVPVKELKEDSNMFSFSSSAIPETKKTTTELDLAGQSLGAEGALVLSTCLENGVLSKLDLSDNNNSTSQSLSFIKLVAGALNTNTTITELNLSGNKLTAVALQHFSEAIKDNRALKKLDISSNYHSMAIDVGSHLSEQFMRPIDSILKTNPGVTELAQHYQPVAQSRGSKKFLDGRQSKQAAARVEWKAGAPEGGGAARRTEGAERGCQRAHVAAPPQDAVRSPQSGEDARRSPGEEGSVSVEGGSSEILKSSTSQNRRLGSSIHIVVFIS